MSRLIFLLPAWSVFGRQGLMPALSTAFGRADDLDARAAGIEAQLSRHFVTVPAGLSPAALTRQADVGDAAGSMWLRADPAHVRPDINGARLLGIGERLGLDAQDIQALLPALKPVFGEAGFELDAPTPTRWYLRLPRESSVPAFSVPDDALGGDLFEHQPGGPEGRRWRALLNEAQIVLHNHPWNAQRAERGLVPVNSLWLWGGGLLPDSIRSNLELCCSDDDLPVALTHIAGGSGRALPRDFTALFTPSVTMNGDWLVDLRRVRDFSLLQRDWLLPAVCALHTSGLRGLVIDNADGSGLHLHSGQRWRFWRRAWSMPTAGVSS